MAHMHGITQYAVLVQLHSPQTQTPKAKSQKHHPGAPARGPRPGASQRLVRDIAQRTCDPVLKAWTDTIEQATHRGPVIQC
jgi:hypothetical protein